MLIKIKVIPKSSQNKIIRENNIFRINPKPEQVRFRVKITDAPEKGKANKKVVKLLAKEFKVAKSQVEIIKGLTSQNKLVKINNKEKLEIEKFTL